MTSISIHLAKPDVISLGQSGMEIGMPIGSRTKKGA